MDNLSALAKYISLRFAPTEQQKEYAEILDLSLKNLSAGNTLLSCQNPSELKKFSKDLIITEDQVLNGQTAALVLCEDNLYLYKIYKYEHDLAQKILDFTKTDQSSQPYCHNIKDNNLNPKQQDALNMALNKNLSIILGGPGTGKTYTLAKIVQNLLNNQNEKIAIAAPTGKAAKRIEESLRKAIDNQEINKIPTAQTIHRLLGINNGNAKFNADNPLAYSLVVIDEASMLSLEITYYLFAALAKDTKLILLGDANQLAAVEAGAVLQDMSKIDFLQNNIITLTESHRFKENSELGNLSNSIINGDANKTISLLDEGKNIKLLRQSNTFYDDICRDYQNFFDISRKNPMCSNKEEIFSIFNKYRILAANREGNFGAEKINQIISNFHRKHNCIEQYKNFFPGLALLVNNNDYNNGLFNGDIGICLFDQNQNLKLFFEHLEHPIDLSKINSSILSPAYALTIHKSQGSEFEKISIILDKNRTKILSRELLYTGITRAKNKLDIYADENSLKIAINNPSKRSTGLNIFFNRSKS